MNVEHAELIELDGRPALGLRIDGQRAWIFEPKRSLLELGYAVLVDDVAAPAGWAERLPVLHVPGDPAQGRAPLALHGATADPLVVALARGFWNRCNGHGRFEPQVIDLAAVRARLPAPGA